MFVLTGATMRHSTKLLTAPRAALLATCAAGALFTAAAHAADAPAPAAPAADTTPVTADIVVTATRRNESIQSVPMTLQALSGNALSQLNVTTFNDLLKFTPNVTFASNGPGQGAIFMRGLSTGFAGNQSSGTIAPFPNVALYLDDQSMQFPARNADVYMADMSRVEVLEGPQGTLFGGGAEAGAVRYITNKPVMDRFEGHFEGSVGGTVGGAPNGSFSATINIPVISDKLAIRATIYDDHHGGYIDNVKSTFTRNASDPGSVGYGFVPTAANQSNAGQYNNYALARKNFNPVDYQGGRIEAQWDITPDWNLLVTESYQNQDAEGSFSTYPIGSDGQKLGTLQTTVFTPEYNKDSYWNTAWTVNGKIGDWKVVYTGAYMSRKITEQQDYSNYSRTGGGMYYQCTGSATGFGKGATYCYSPVAYWHDKIKNTHQSHEFRVSSPENKRIRVIGGVYYEKFHISDVMNFDYETIPSCTTSLISQGAACSGVVSTYPGSTANNPGTEPAGAAFGEDTQRGYDQFAAFATADIDILPNLTLTGGTRYYHYKEFEVGSQFQTYAGNCYEVVVCAIAGGGNHSIDADNDHVTYHGFKSKGTLTWKPADRTLVYGTFSQGFRPGGFNRRGYYVLNDVNGVPQFFRPKSYAPDSLTNWELGLKTDLLDHKVTFNLSAYYMVWQNVQIGFFNPAGGFGNTSFVTNGANFHVKGLEAQFVARPVDGVTIQGGATYNKSKQVTTPCLPVNNPLSVNNGQCLKTYYSGTTAINVQSPFGNAGSELPYSPNVQADIRARYEWNGGADIKWFSSIGVGYTGPTYNQPATYPTQALCGSATIPCTTVLRYHMSGYAIADAAIGISRDEWKASIFADNFTNSHASTFTSSAQFIKSEVPVRPMTYGVKFAYDFK